MNRLVTKGIRINHVLSRLSIGLLAIGMLVPSPAQAQPLLDDDDWKIDAGSVTWFQNDHLTRGLAYNRTTGNVYVVSRTGGVNIRIINGETGDVTGQLSTTGISGGTFPLNVIGVSRDGEIFAANLTVNTGGDNPSPLKIYHWENEAADPTVVFEGLESTFSQLGANRYGDAMTVEGTGNNIHVYVSGSLNNQIAKFAFNGTTLDAPEVLSIPAGAARGGIAEIPGQDSLWINGAGTAAMKVSNQTGAVGTTMPGGVLSTGNHTIQYFTFEGRSFVAVGPLGTAAEGQQFRIADVTTHGSFAVVGMTAQLGPNTNDNAAGAAAFDPTGGRFFVLGTNNAIAAYGIESPFTNAFEANLAGYNEVPPNTSMGTGSVNVELFSNEMKLSGSFSGLSAPLRQVQGTPAHIHFAPAGENGGIAILLDVTADTDTSGTFEEENNTITLTHDQVAALFAGNYYVNIHTDAFPPGEIRGQLLSSPNTAPMAAALTAPMDGHAFTISGDASQTLNIAWDAASDPDGDRVVYVWQVATDTDFENIVVNRNTVTATQTPVTYGDLDRILAAAGVGIDDTATLYHRVNSSDGSERTLGAARTMEVTRGTVYIPIVDARMRPPPQTVSVEGIVTRAMGRTTRIQDDTGAITTFQSTGAFRDAVNAGDVRRGDLIRITGTRADFQMQVQLTPTAWDVVSRDNELPEPQLVTLADVAAQGAQLEGQLLHLETVTIDALGDSVFVANKSYPISDASLEAGTVFFRVQAATDTELPGTAIPGQPFTYEGVLGRFGAEFQLIPVELTDITIEEITGEFEAMLSGLHENPPIMTPASGSITAQLDEFELVLTGTFSGLLADYTASHIHVGRAGVNGGVEIGLSPTLDEGNRGGTYEAANNAYTLTSDQRNLLLNGELYVNIHSQEHPGGEIRGQLLASPNAAPTASEITSPEDGADLTIEGDGRQTVNITWTEAEDPDGDLVVYRWQLATDADFAMVLATVGTDTLRMLQLTYSEVDQLLAAAGLEVGDTVTVYHRAISSDGSALTFGPGASVNLTRGEVFTVMTIADARDVEPPGEVTVEGIVTRAMGRTTRIQDETGAITTFQSSGDFWDAVGAGDVRRGDLIRITGNRADFREQIQLSPTSWTVISRDNPLPAPQLRTLAEIADEGAELEGQLIRVENLTIDPMGHEVFAANATYPISDPSLEAGTVNFRVQAATDSELPGTAIPMQTFIFEGVLGRFDDEFQLIPVEVTDVIPGKLPEWAILPGDRAWFQNDNNTRGAAFNPATGNIVVISRTGGLNMQRLDAYSGASRGTMSVSGIEGGLFILNLLGITSDGQIFANNLTLNGATTNLKVYRWANEMSAPEVIFDAPLEAMRYGDAIGVGGAGDDVQIYISGSGTDHIVVLNWDGEQASEPTFIPVQTGAARLGIAPVEGEDALWINGFGTTTRKISTEDGSIIHEIPESVLSPSTSVAGYHDFDGTQLLAVGPSLEQQFQILDVTDLNNIRVAAFMDRMTQNDNLNRTGAASFDTFHNRLVVLNTNDQLASYSIEELVGEALFARAQPIHNAADPAAASVDVFVDGQLHLSGFGFRHAMPFATIAAGEELTIDVAAAGQGIGEAFYTTTVTFAAGETYYGILVGVVDPGDFAANPDGRDIAFQIDWVEGAVEEAGESDEVDVLFYHGVTDEGLITFDTSPPIPTKTENEFDLRYTDISDQYVPLSEDHDLIGVTRDGRLRFYEAGWDGMGGLTAVVLASGFANPGENQGGEPFEVFAAFSNGSRMVLPVSTISTEPGTELPLTFKLHGNYPNPFNPSTLISFDLPAQAEVTIELYDVIGRRVMTLPQEGMSAGANQTVRVDGSQLGSGVYFYRVIAETATERFVESGKMTLVK